MTYRDPPSEKAAQDAWGAHRFKPVRAFMYSECNLEYNPPEIRYRNHACFTTHQAFPNGMCPKKLIKVDKIPVDRSGKPDLSHSKEPPEYDIEMYEAYLESLKDRNSAARDANCCSVAYHQVPYGSLESDLACKKAPTDQRSGPDST